MSDSAETIEMTVQVARVQTLADGGLRFTLDAPETAIMQAAQLMECKRFGVVLKLTAEPIEQEEGRQKISERFA